MEAVFWQRILVRGHLDQQCVSNGKDQGLCMTSSEKRWRRRSRWESLNLMPYSGQALYLLQFSTPLLMNHPDPNSRHALTRRETSPPERKPPWSKLYPFIHKLHINLRKPIVNSHLHQPREPESQIPMIQLRLRLLRHRHRAIAEEAGGVQPR